MAEDDKDDREDELEGGRMPLLDHLIELRNRLLWSFGAIIIAWAVCYYFSAAIYRFLAHPLAVIFAGEPGRKMIFTALTEAFFTYLKVSFWAAIAYPSRSSRRKSGSSSRRASTSRSDERSCPICVRHRCYSRWAHRSPISS
jgi:hypothetical protein